MKSYTVHLPLEARDPETIAGELKVVPDAGSFLAFLLGPLWLMAKGAWLWGLAIGVIELGLAFLPDPFGLIVNLLFAGLIGLEGHQLVRHAYSRGRWRMVDLVSARDSEEAESAALARLLAARSEPPAYGLPQRVNAPAGIGLFPTAGA